MKRISEKRGEEVVVQKKKSENGGGKGANCKSIQNNSTAAAFTLCRVDRGAKTCTIIVY